MGGNADVRFNVLPVGAVTIVPTIGRGALSLDRLSYCRGDPIADQDPKREQRSDPERDSDPDADSGNDDNPNRHSHSRDGTGFRQGLVGQFAELLLTDDSN